MICQHCKDQEHNQCAGGTWCDCGHRVAQTVEQADAAELPPWLGDVVDQALERHNDWVRKFRPERHDR